jgi:hypothetical protein
MSLFRASRLLVSDYFPNVGETFQLMSLLELLVYWVVTIFPNAVQLMSLLELLCCLLFF